MSQHSRTYKKNLLLLCWGSVRSWSKNVLLSAMIVLILFNGCSLFGGNPTTIAPDPETTVKPEQITDLTKKIEAVNSTIMTKEEITNLVKTEVHTQITSVVNNMETPFWEIVTPLAIFYLIWELLKLTKALIMARLRGGSTFKNLIGLN